MRYRVEAGVVLLYAACLAARLAANGALEVVTCAFLVLVVAPLAHHVFVTAGRVDEHRSLALVPRAHCRPMCDDGVPHGLLLVPLVVGGSLAALTHVAAAGEHVAYIAHSLKLSLLMSVVLTAHLHLDAARRGGTAGTVARVAAVQLIGAVLWHWVDGLSLAALGHTTVCVAGFQVLLHVLLLGFPKSFSPGEAAVVAQLLVLLGGDALAATAFRFRLVQLPAFMNLSRSPIHLFLQSLILGMVMIGVLLSPLLYRLRRLSLERTTRPMLLGYGRESVGWSALFVLGVLAIVFLVISPWMRFFLHTDPFFWTFSFLLESWRLHLVVYWALAIAASVTALSWASSYIARKGDAPGTNGTVANGTHGKHATAAAADAKPRLPLILVRKYFHLLAVAMFSPGLLLEPFLLQLAFGVALSVLLLVEYIRLSDVFPLGRAVRTFMESFVDHRDSGPLVLSHIYLLLGCAVPMWLSPVPPTSFFAPFSGIITIGIGDTMASVVGIHLGRTRWPQTSKTVEGTLAGIASCIAVSAALYAWCPVVLALSTAQQLLYVGALALAGLMEAHTQQIDNLTVPLYLLSSVCLL